MKASSATVISIVGVVLESYKSNILEYVASIPQEKRAKITDILDYFLKDILIVGLKKNLNSDIEVSSSVSDTIGNILKNYIQQELITKYGVVNNEIKIDFFVEPYMYKQDVKFLISVSDSNIDYRQILNRYVIQNANRISKTLVKLIQIPLETIPSNQQQQHVRMSILKELGKDPITGMVVDFVKENIDYAVRSNINTFTTMMKDKVYENVTNKVLDVINAGFNKLFGRFLGNKNFELLEADSILEFKLVNKKGENLKPTISGSLKKLITSRVKVALLKSMKKIIFEAIKKRKLEFFLIVSFILLVIYSFFSAIFKIFKFIFKIIKFILTLPIKIYFKFFKKENVEKITEELLYNKKKKQIYYDKMSRVYKLCYYYETLV